MIDFQPSEQRAFLKFVTGCPRLPVGGKLITNTDVKFLTITSYSECCHGLVIKIQQNVSHGRLIDVKYMVCMYNCIV